MISGDLQDELVRFEDCIDTLNGLANRFRDQGHDVCMSWYSIGREADAPRPRLTAQVTLRFGKEGA